MALNFAGQPLGSALAGPVINTSLTAALIAAVAVTLIATPLPLLLIPAASPRLEGPDGQQHQSASQKL